MILLLVPIYDTQDMALLVDAWLLIVTCLALPWSFLMIEDRMSPTQTPRH